MTDVQNALGTIEHVDPTQIEVETNIRTVVALSREFVDSIREHGVLQPVLCRRRPDGTLVVRAGQRRVLGAREARRPTVPAYVVEGEESTVTRLVEQFVENDHRASLTLNERAAVFLQMELEGLSVPTIAKRTGVKKAEVEAGIKVAQSQFAKDVAEDQSLTLDQAAVLIEFEGDQRAIDALTQTALYEEDQFEHETQLQRDRRQEEAIKTTQVQELTEQGYTLLDWQPYGGYVRIEDLVTKEGEPVTREHLVEVAEKYAHVAVYSADEVEVSVYLKDPKVAGFKKAPTTGTAGGGMTEEEKAERRALIANNKAWDSAEVVRRDWLRTFLSRKSLPKDAATFVATALVEDRATVASGLSDGNEWACELLGLDKPTWQKNPLSTYLAEHPTKTTHTALAVVTGAIEGHLGRHSWRNPTQRDAAYLDQIVAWGYALSEVEQIISAATKAKSSRTRRTSAKPTTAVEAPAAPTESQDGQSVA